MFTKETICKEIRDFSNGSMTPQSTELLAYLMIIYDHRHLLPGGETKTTVEKQSSDLLCEWVDRMENADGTTGPHWSRHEAAVIQAKNGITCGDVEFYTALNMMYSDYCAALEQAGAATVELYARMAAAFLNDKDAQPDKLSRYYQYIARHS